MGSQGDFHRDLLFCRSSIEFFRSGRYVEEFADCREAGKVRPYSHLSFHTNQPSPAFFVISFHLARVSVLSGPLFLPYQAGWLSLLSLFCSVHCL